MNSVVCIVTSRMHGHLVEKDTITWFGAKLR